MYLYAVEVCILKVILLLYIIIKKNVFNHNDE